MKKRICIVGHGRAGKDTMADWLDDHTDLVHPGSLSWFLTEEMAIRGDIPHEIREKVGLAMHFKSYVRALWERRHEDREFWKAYGTRLREENPGILIDAALRDGDMVVGCRDKAEVEHVRESGKCDLIVWVARPGIPDDPTIEFGSEVADVVIVNDSTEERFLGKVERFARFAGLL